MLRKPAAICARATQLRWRYGLAADSAAEFAAERSARMLTPLREPRYVSSSPRSSVARSASAFLVVRVVVLDGRLLLHDRLLRRLRLLDVCCSGLVVAWLRVRVVRIVRTALIFGGRVAAAAAVGVRTVGRHVVRL